MGHKTKIKKVCWFCPAVAQIIKKQWQCKHLSCDMTKPTKCAPSEDSDQPRHPPSLIRVFAVSMKKHWALSYPLSAQQRLWSDRVEAQADLSFRWAHTHFVGFVMSWLILLKQCMTLLHIHKMYKGWLSKLFIKVFNTANDVKNWDTKNNCYIYQKNIL